MRADSPERRIQHDLPETAASPPVETGQGVYPATPLETILVVDDDAAVRVVLARILTRAGYTVLTAGAPSEAEAVAAGHPGDIHLLMTDLMLPDMDGGELARRLRAARPAARVLYTSGYTNESVVRSGLIPADVPFLSKPFTIDEVVPKVREALA